MDPSVTPSNVINIMIECPVAAQCAPWESGGSGDYNPMRPDNIEAVTIGCIIMLQIVTALFMIARIYVNRWHRALKSEDVCAYIAWACFVVGAICASVLVHLLDKPLKNNMDSTMPERIKAAKLYHTFCVMYTLCSGFSKTTVSIKRKLLIDSNIHER